MKYLKPLLKILSKSESILLTSMFAFTMAILFITILMRYIFNSSPTWTEEASRYLLIWIIYLGVSLSIEQGTEIRIDILTRFFNTKSMQNIANFFSLVVSIFISIFMCIYGIKFSHMLYQFQEQAASFNLPMYIIYSIIPLGGAIMTLKYILKLAEMLTIIKE